MSEPLPRVALVTGGSRGLGAGLVGAFLDAGYCVETCARTTTDAVRAWEDDPEYKERFHFTTADVSDPAAAERMVKEAAERWGRIDVLVNNAGVAREGVIGLFGDEALDQVIDLNLKGTVYVTRAASRVMLSRRAGAIVNISSVVGLSGYRGLSVYGATKAALDGLTRALARELGSRGITVNSVAPGYLRTEMSHGLDEDQLGQIAAPHAPWTARGARGRGAGRALPHRSGQQVPHRPGGRGGRRVDLLTSG